MLPAEEVERAYNQLKITLMSLFVLLKGFEQRSEVFAKLFSTKSPSTAKTALGTKISCCHPILTARLSSARTFIRRTAITVRFRRGILNFLSALESPFTSSPLAALPPNARALCKVLEYATTLSHRFTFGIIHPLTLFVKGFLKIALFLSFFRLV